MCGKLTGVLRAFKRRSKLHGLPAQGRPKQSIAAVYGSSVNQCGLATRALI